MKILIVHYDKLINRKKYMLEQLSKYNLEAEFISNYGKENLTYDDKKLFKNITDGEISVALHHIQCYKKIIENDYNYALILEDDVILSENFINILNKYISDLPSIWDMLFIGDGGGYHIPDFAIKQNINIYRKHIYPSKWGGMGATRCLDSYLVTKRCASIILERIKLSDYRIVRPIDMWLNDVIRNNKFNVYWAEPTIVTQGSKKGLYKSALR